MSFGIKSKLAVCSKRIPCTPLPVIPRLHSCGECGLGTAVVSLEQGSQKDQKKGAIDSE